MQRRLSGPGVCYARRCATIRAGAWFMSELGFIIMCQSTDAFGRISYPGLVALFALGNMAHYSFATLYLVVLTSMSGCCLWCTEHWILREMTLAVPQCLAQYLVFF